MLYYDIVIYVICVFIQHVKHNIKLNNELNFCYNYAYIR